ncbi:MAG: SH3 domain-containing protein [Lachnospiraceae bacterium]|nr:SH3 domain-containing protein [Lachnospiraceae bacterium]
MRINFIQDTANEERDKIVKRRNSRAVSGIRKTFLAVAFAFILFLSCGGYNVVVQSVDAAAKYYKVTGTENYLALRSEPSYNRSNEIGKLYNGDTVQYIHSGEGKFWYVSSSVGEGYVNKDFLTPTSSSAASNSDKSVPVNQGVYSEGFTYNTMKVTGTKNYLALRSGHSADSSNEIGKIYNGDTVTLIKDHDTKYWLVYAPTVGKFGFVNADYLELAANRKFTYVMNDIYVAEGMSNYLALRNAMSYSSSNEIGKIYFGEPVENLEEGNSTYCKVYAPTLNKYGYVDKSYLRKVAGQDSASYTSYKVRGVKNYLALRNEMKKSSSNEIGKIWEGERVEFIGRGDSTYWFVYAPTLGKYGYVDNNYLA